MPPIETWTDVLLALVALILAVAAVLYFVWLITLMIEGVRTEREWRRIRGGRDE